MSRKRSSTTSLSVLPDRRSVAFHEAGHAVVAHHLDVPILQVSIRPSGRSLGRVTLLGVGMIDFGLEPLAKARTALARDQIVAWYAGLLAQRLVDPNASHENAKDDEERAIEVSKENGIYPREYRWFGDELHLAYLERFRRKARRLVRELRPQIEAFAEILMLKEVLAGRDLRKALEGLW